MIGLDFTTPPPVPNAFPSGIESEALAEALELLAETGRQLWRELFLEIETEEQLTDWELRIPSYGCDCQAYYLNWKLTNPPAFPLQPRWKYDLKTAVNTKLKRPNLTWPEACHLWGWRESS